MRHMVWIARGDLLWMYMRKPLDSHWRFLLENKVAPGVHAIFPVTLVLMILVDISADTVMPIMMSGWCKDIEWTMINILLFLSGDTGTETSSIRCHSNRGFGESKIYLKSEL